MSLEYDVAAFSVQGQRETMEDAYYLDHTKGLFIVADGVWGSEHGDEASKLAVDTAVENFEKERVPSNPSKIEKALKRIVAVTQSVVRAQFGDGRKGSTTLTLLLATDSHLSYCSVGDSRLYVVKAPPVSLHSWWGRLVSTPLLFHQLTKDNDSFIGQEEPVLNSGIYPLVPGDGGFLLCTDGLYKCPSKLEWSELTGRYEYVLPVEHFGKARWAKNGSKAELQYERSPRAEVEFLRQLCVNAHDNVTAIYALFRNRPIQL